MRWEQVQLAGINSPNYFVYDGWGGVAGAPVGTFGTV